MSLQWYYTGNIADPSADFSLIIESRGGTKTAYPLEEGFENLFDHVLAPDALAGQIEYRCLILEAVGADFESIELFISQQTSNADTDLEIAWEGIEDGFYTPIAKTGAEITAPLMYGAVGIVDSKGFQYDGKTGSDIAAGDTCTWPGGSGTCYYNDDTDTMAIHGISGTPLADDTVITSSGNTVTVNGAVSDFSKVWADYTTVSRLSLPDLIEGEAHRIWFKRTVDPDCDSDPNDNCKVKVEYIQSAAASSSTTT
jgi:hypothetical protein